MISNSVQNLLDEVEKISNKYEVLNRSTGREFNIFNIFDIKTKEVKICEVIYELLNPEGSHYQGDKYLRLFFEIVLQIKINEEEFKDIKVKKEEVIENKKGRVDLVIETKESYIPIEVKINAKDQKDQCEKYLEEAQKKGSNKLYYLTPNQVKPKKIDKEFQKKIEIFKIEDMKEQEEKKQIILISFEKHILKWLKKCAETSIKLPPIREIIFQLIKTISEFTNTVEENEGKEIEGLIGTNTDNIKSAIEIDKNIERIKIDHIKRVFSSIKLKLGRESREIIEKEYNEKRYEKYYKEKKYFPTISYLMNKDKGICVDITIYESMLIHYRVINKKGEYLNFNSKKFKDISSKDLLKGITMNSDEESLHYEYIINNNEIETPDFWNFNESYLKTYDEKYFDNFIENCVKRIKEFLEVKEKNFEEKKNKNIIFVNNDSKEIFKKTYKNIKSAIKINEILEEVKLKHIEKFFKSVENKMDKLDSNYKKVDKNKKDRYNNKDYFKNFYKHKKNPLTISYYYQRNVKGDIKDEEIDIIVNLTMGESILIGYSLLNKEGECLEILEYFSEEKLKSYFKIKEKINTKDFSIKLEKISDEDFYNCNKNYLKTYDKEEFEKFTDECVKKLKEFLEKKQNKRKEIISNMGII